MADTVPMQNNDPELTMLLNDKQSGYDYRERRHEDWKETYLMYRDRVIVNRLTQRQSVNIPLMKQTVKTLLKDVDDMPVVYYESLDNDAQAEVFQNEYWKWTIERNNMEIQDIVDKRQVFLFGRTFDQMQICDGYVKMTVEDPQDLLVDRYMNPTNIDSSRFLIHTHIFVPLSSLENNPDYDELPVKELRQWYSSEEGLIKNATNQQMLTEKNERLADMGLSDVNDPILGETIVELTMYFVYRQEGTEEEQLYLYVEADDMKIIMKKRLEDVIGVTKDHYWRNHFPYNTWADDVERQDFWSDGVGDIVKTPNKVLNSWFSQLVENRTLRNFGMHYYDATKEGFAPQTFQAIPWGWYPVPGKPTDVVEKVDIPDLSESLDEMTYVTQIIEKATGATATQQGVQTERQVTLGEVQLALGEAKERVKGMSKFYTTAWKQRGEKFLKLIEAAHDKLDAVKLYKKGRNTDKLYQYEASPNDWMTKSGYTTRVWSQEERNAQNTQSLERVSAANINMPGNPKLTEIYQRKLLEFADLNPDEVNEVMQYEKDKMQMMNASGIMGAQTNIQPQLGAPPMPPQQPMAAQ